MSALRKLKPWQIGIAVCMIYFMADLSNIISPALASLSEFYPDRTLLEIQELAVANRLLAIVGCVLAGWAAGRKIGNVYISMRLVVCISFLCQIIGGVLPMVDMHNFPLVQFSRYLFGFGNGMCGGLSGAVMCRCFAEGALRNRWLGIGGFFQGFGGVIVPLLAGYVVAIDVSYVWPLHLVAVICLAVFLIWFEEPREEAATTTPDTAEGAEALANDNDPRPRHLTFGAWLCAILFFLDVVAVHQLLINTSYIVEFGGWGDSAMSGWVLTIYFIGAALGSLVFPYFAKWFGRFCIGVGLIICAVGYAIGFVGHSLIALYICSFVLGVAANGIFLTGGFAYLGKRLHPTAVTTASGIFNAGGNLGAFVSAYLTAFVVNTIFQSTDYSYALIAGLVVYAVGGIIWMIFAAATEKKEDWADQEA